MLTQEYLKSNSDQFSNADRLFLAHHNSRGTVKAGGKHSKEKTCWLIFAWAGSCTVASQLICEKKKEKKKTSIPLIHITTIIKWDQDYNQMTSSEMEAPFDINGVRGII